MAASSFMALKYSGVFLEAESEQSTEASKSIELVNNLRAMVP